MPLLLVLLACPTPTDDTALPEICHESGSYTSGTRFQDRTTTWNLDGVKGGRLRSADLDGDGYPDLIVSEASPHKRDTYDDPETRQRWLLMNRPGPDGTRVFEDVSESSGLFETRDGDGGHSATIHVFGDVDNDGDLDVAAGVYVDQNDKGNDPGDRSEIYLNQGDGSFELGPKTDLDIRIGYATAGMSWTDADQDGNLDLWVVGFYETYGYLYGEQDSLYRGDGTGDLTDVTQDVGLMMERGTSSSLDPWLAGTARRSGYGATVCDLDNNGWPDLLATNYGRAWNQQWMNEDGQFTDVGQTSGFAGDEVQDYSDNQFYRCYCDVNGCEPDPGSPSLGDCATYANYWSPGFDDQPARLNGNSFTTACGDIDRDGDMDLVTAEIVHWHIGASSDPTELLVNDGTGTFSRPGRESTGLTREHASSDWNEGDITAGLLDFDNDGRLDVLVGSSDYDDTRVLLYHQQADGSFQEVAEETGVDWPLPAGLTTGDFDRDGDVDILVGSSTMRVATHEDHQVHLFENTGGGNHARILLEGEDSNRAGIGARISVTAGGETQHFEVSGGYGHFGLHNGVAVHAGLDEACTWSAEVAWPGGSSVTYDALMANYEVVLGEDGSISYRPL